MTDKEQVYANLTAAFVAIGEKAKEAAEEGNFDELPSAAQLRLTLEWTKSRTASGGDPMDDNEVDKALAESLAEAGEWGEMPEPEDEGE